MDKVCGAEECDRPVLARGWCGKHYQRWLKGKDPNEPSIRDRPLKCQWCQVDIDEATAKRYGRQCSLCRGRRAKARIYADPDRHEAKKTYDRRSVLSYHHRLRFAALQAYGAVCVCCGETHEAFLAIDHVNNDGAAHRKELGVKTGAGPTKFYRWLRDNDYPQDGRFQCLCHNCNWAKSNYPGGCPHQQEVEK